MMKKNYFLRAAIVLLLPLFAAAQAETIDTLKAESFGLILDQRWLIECVAQSNQSFNIPLKQYKFHREQSGDIIQTLNQNLKNAFGESFSMHSGADMQAPTLLYSGNAPYNNIGLPSFMPQSAPLSCEQLSAIEACRLILQDIGWRPDDTLYIQSSLEELYKRNYLATMGRLSTKEEYLNAMVQHEGVKLPIGTEKVVIITAEIDQYPIIPTLLGSYSEDDVPIYARLLLDENKLLYLDIGCGYVIDASNTVNATPLTYEDALKIAAQGSYRQWQTAWAYKASETEANFDYPKFWRDYDPHFVLRILRAEPSYYAKDSILSPCWQVDCEIDVILKNDEALSDEERHAYVPEIIDISYIIDAFTGDIVN